MPLYNPEIHQTTHPPRLICPECHDTRQYVGLCTVEPCRACTGYAVEITPAQVTVATQQVVRQQPYETSIRITPIPGESYQEFRMRSLDMWCEKLSADNADNATWAAADAAYAAAVRRKRIYR